jgi:hypothetical protein
VEELGLVGVGEVAGAARVRALLEEREDPEADTPCVTDIAEKVGMFAHARDAKCLAVGAAGDDELVVGDVDQVTFGFRLLIRPGNHRLARGLFGGIGLDADNLTIKIDVVGPALVEADFAWQSANRFQNGAELEGADRCRGQQRSEDEVGAWRDDDALVLGWVKCSSEAISSPPGAEDHDPWLMRHILWEGSQLWLDTVVEVRREGTRTLGNAEEPARS